jgi:hypothetical protein
MPVVCGVIYAYKAVDSPQFVTLDITVAFDAVTVPKATLYFVPYSTAFSAAAPMVKPDTFAFKADASTPVAKPDIALFTADAYWYMVPAES